MRLAVVTDVHGDIHALDDALAVIDRMGCEIIVCAGDVIDFGLFPDETIARLAERQIPTIRGNHERWAIEGRYGGADITPASKRWLRGLPRDWRATLEGVRVAMHHASPKGDMDGIIPGEIKAHEARHHLRAADADVLIVGHTHLCFRLELGYTEGVIVNPGALLRSPADGAGNPPATGTFGVLELPSATFTVHRALDGIEATMLRCRC